MYEARFRADDLGKVREELEEVVVELTTNAPKAQLEGEIGDLLFACVNLARKAGVDLGRVRQALLGGFAASRVLEVHGERMIARNYVPGFRSKLYQKDLRLANEIASAKAVAIPATALVTQLTNSLMADGGGDLDYSAIGTVIEKLSRGAGD